MRLTPRSRLLKVSSERGQGELNVSHYLYQQCLLALPVNTDDRNSISDMLLPRAMFGGGFLEERDASAPSSTRRCLCNAFSFPFFVLGPFLLSPRTARSFPMPANSTLDQGAADLQHASQYSMNDAISAWGNLVHYLWLCPLIRLRSDLSSMAPSWSSLHCPTETGASRRSIACVQPSIVLTSQHVLSYSNPASGRDTYDAARVGRRKGRMERRMAPRASCRPVSFTRAEERP